MEFVAAALSLIRREITRLFANHGPTADPYVISETYPGVVTGSINASDPEGDPLSYTVTEGPANGTVTVDADGNFTYTANEALAATGGTDSFVVAVRDTGLHLNFWTPTTTAAPVTLVVNAAPGLLGSSGAAAAAAVAAGTTTTITWNWGANPVINFNPATDKLDFGWMQPANFDVTEKAGSTVISITDNSHTYTLSGVALKQLSMSNIVAKDAGTVTKWQTLISTAQQPVAPTVSIAGASKAEGNSGTSNLGFTVTLSKASTTPVTVKYATANGTATAGQDYTAGSGTITFAAGETSKTVNVAVAGDTTVESDETFTVALSAPSGATLGAASATGTITNDDVAPTLPTVSIAGASKSEGNSGTSNLGFTVTLSKASTTPVTVQYATANGTATAGQDYTAASGTITFAAGETTKTVNVVVAGDTTAESDETLTVTLSAPSGATIATASATGTITNDDVAPTLPTVSIAGASKSEGNSGTSNLGFTVTLSKASTTPVTVQFATSNGTATAGQDYTAASGTITFAAGETSKTVNVVVAGDATVESDETLTVTLSSPSGATIATASAVGMITNDDTAGGGTPGGGGINSGNAGDSRWGEAFFAPYVDIAGWPPPDLTAIAQANGVSLVTLAFIQATTDGKAAWGGYTTLTPGSTDTQAKAIDATIAAFKAAGGDVLVSFGGANGTSLAQYYSQHGKSAQELADAYGGIVDAYGLNRIDFDIEGAAVADGSSVLNAQALKILQTARPDLEVWYTLPVLPTGLTADGLNVVDQALKAGVKLDGINVMAMDYGESAAPTSGPNAKSMGTYAIQSAQSTYDQMTPLFSKYGQTFNWRQIGVTPMIGVNDIQSEVFTVADAQALETFARNTGIGMLSMWSVQRDLPATGGGLGQASPANSGLADAAGSFSKTWNDYGAQNTMNYTAPGGGGTPVTGGTTTVIGWNWAQNAVLNFNPAKDKLDFGWMQPIYFDVSDATGSTVITIKDSGGQTYTLNGVTLGQLQMGNIIALDSTTTAKWQGLISTAQSATPMLSVASASKAEGNSGTSNLAFTVSLSKASTSPVTVNYATSNGTATAGQDYTAASGTITFAAGETSKTVNVVVAGDATVEPDETFTVTLSNASGAGITAATATGTITNDDIAPALSIGSASKAEGSSGTSNLAFTVTLSKASTTPVTVNYATSNGTATAGQDYTAASGTVTFAAGETSKTVNVAIAGDTAAEDDETFTVTLSSPSGATIATASATGTITNDDGTPPPSVSIGNTSKAEGNSGTSNLAFTVTLSKASTTPVTVNYATSNGTATAGQDYTAASGTITFAAGETSKTVNVAVAGDATVESDETLTVTLSSPSGAVIGTATATGTITNDDGLAGSGINSGNAGDAKWGEAFYAPYVDMAGWPPPDLTAIAKARGVSLMTLAFLQANSAGQAAWGGYSTLTPGGTDDQEKSIDSAISKFKAAGGDVMISFGGAAGTSLAQYYAQHGKSAQELANAYGAVVDTYGLNRIDFDIEGAAVADPSSIALHAAALKILQTARPDLEVWYTLPVLPTGLDNNGLNVVDQALKAGVKLDGINVMAMDYGESSAPTTGSNAKSMGAYAIQAAQSTYDQMTTLFTKYGQTFNWRQIGVTPMIGVNDVQSEVFKVSDAQALEDFARTKGIGMLSMWSITRDTPGSLGQASSNASGLSDAAGSFSNVWNDYGTTNTVNL